MQQLDTLASTAWRDDVPGDVLIFCGWVPSALPPGRPALVIAPPQGVGPLRVERLDPPVIADPPRVADRLHPLLHGVASGRCVVTQTATITTGNGLEGLWTSPAGCLLAAGEVAGARLAVLGFAPERSERLGLTAAQPLLLANAVLWLVQGDRKSVV